MYFGRGAELDTLQMCSRSVIIFFITLALIRIAGIRTFGKRSAFDNVILITLGAVMSRAIVGASGFLPVVCSCFILVIIHRLLAWLSVKHDGVGNIVKGEPVNLYEKGKENKRNMNRASISRKDMEEGIRMMIQEESMNNIEKIILERNGEISVITKD